MHEPRTWLLVLLCWSSYASAFYPYTVHQEKRAVEVLDNEKIQFRRGSEDGWLRADIHRVPKQKRDNQFAFVQSNPATGGPNALTINQDGSDYSYFSTIKFGSKAQEMFMLIDTGSADTWVFSSDCKSSPCDIHNTFGKEDSTTLKATTETWDRTYGTGEVSGIVASDTVVFADFSLNLGFGLAVNASDDFNGYPMDGILGLGRRSSGQLGTPTLMDVLDDQAKLQQNILGIHLHRAKDGTKDGEILFGAVDTGKFSGSLAYTKTVSDGAWEIPVGDFLLDGVTCNFTGRTAIIDTGTTFILMPPRDALALHSLIPGAVASGESFTMPCNTNVKLEVSINGIKYQISPQDYIGKPTQDGATTCTSNIIGHQAFGATQWILGDVFLKNVYAAFDFDNKQIGFGLLGSGGSATPATSSTSPSTASSSTSTLSPSSSASASASGSGASATSSGRAGSDSTLGQDNSNDASAIGNVLGYWKVGFSLALPLVAGLIM